MATPRPIVVEETNRAGSKQQTTYYECDPALINRSSKLFVVPPYVEDEGAPPNYARNRYSFGPTIIEDPARALSDRVRLSGARGFDVEAERRRDAGTLDFPTDLFALGSMANVGVSAAWTAATLSQAALIWAANPSLPNG